MEIINQYLSVVIVVICTVVGYVWKNYTNANNSLIPLVVTVLGVVLALVNAFTNGQAISLDIIAQGLVSGLASTGLHQLVTRLLEKMDSTLPE